MVDLLIKNIRIMQTQPPFTVEEGMDVAIEGSLISKVGKNLALEAKETIDGSGKTLIPGNVCAHHHYYSGLSRGMLISAGPQTDFIQVLKEWWWRLDRGLREESTYYSSLICSLDAIASGTTSCVDHHASPCYIEGSLSTIAKGMEEIGVRGSTCFEVTDRNRGMEEVEEGVAENIRFAKEVDERLKRGEEVLCESTIGGHAPFTIPDEGLKLMGDAMEKTGRGMHIHVAEASYDSVWSHHFYNKDLADRLDSFGLLTPKSLIVHGVHLSEKEIQLINERNCFFAVNPRSNMNNNIGCNTKLPMIKNLCLGTDGCGGNMFEEIKIGFFKHKDVTGPWWPSNFLEVLNRGNRLVESQFGGRIKLGKIEEGYTADIVLLDYNNPTPLVTENAPGHFVWGMGSGCVNTIIVNGKVLFRDHKFVRSDASDIYKRAAEVAGELWKEVDKIKA